MTSKQTRTLYDVTPEQFIEIWETSASVQEASERLKMPSPIVLARVSSYRSKGVKLKKMKRKPSRSLNVDSLNALIDKLDQTADTTKQSLPKKTKSFIDEVIQSIRK